jgi:homoserine O-succinyltransferase/O-acetyltransferase
VLTGQGVAVAQPPAAGSAERRQGAAPLVIGLVNSMPGEARQHTERQFRAILSAAAWDVPMELRFFTLDTLAAGEAAPRYEDAAMLEAAAPDGLIVTGMPPRAAALEDEPYWPRLTELVDFAVDAAIPTLWSCLAAHAAVLYLDGIERRRLPQKLSGLVDCARTEAEHPILAGLPPRWQVPHSRYNDVPEEALAERGYRILSRSAGAGADIFVRDDTAPFLFCQGHPEYDAQALLREYRRDIRQFLTRERDDYPAMPRNYFGPEAAAQLAAFRARACRERTVERLADFPIDACRADVRHAWGDLAVGLYANWLALVAQAKARRAGAGVGSRTAACRVAGAAGPEGSAGLLHS